MMKRDPACLIVVTIVSLVVASCSSYRSPEVLLSPPAPAQLIEPVPSEVAPPKPPLASVPRYIEYAPVSLAEREGHRIELIEDLVIEERVGDYQYEFQDAVGIVVDERGRIYVHDNERYRIVVYRPDGSFLRAYGGAGNMAPFHLGWISLAGQKLAISTGNKVTVWSLDGDYLYDRSLLRRAFSSDVQGTVDGSLVGSFLMLDRALDSWLRVEKISLDDDESLTYSAVPMRRRDRSDPRARADFAATRTGEVYMTRGDEYVVQAFTSDGTARWILYVDWPRGGASEGSGASPPALAAGPRGRGLSRLGRGHPVRVDGHGNVYVFPYVDREWNRAEVPVDVYSPGGERIFGGFITDRSWIRAKDDHVFGIEYDEDTRLQRIVRYRLHGLASIDGPR